MFDLTIIAGASAVAETWHWQPWQWVVAVWVFTVGASVGSFLNVVIYRLPAGLSIAHPPSHCPACKHAIRFYDNIPIVSWLVLRGRCRDCGARFSSRYAWVEVASGAMLLALAATGPLGRYGSLAAMLDDAGAIAAWGGVAHLAVLLASLWSAAAIAGDGHTPPWKLFATPLAVGLGVAFLWPELFAMPMLATLVASNGVASVDSVWIGAIGGVAGALAAGLGAWLVGDTAAGPFGSPSRARKFAFALGAVSGLFLGWQLVLLAGAVAAATRLVGVGILARIKKAEVAGGGSWPMHFAIAVSVGVLVQRVWTTAGCEAWYAAWPGDSLRWWPLAAFSAILISTSLTRIALRGR